MGNNSHSKWALKPKFQNTWIKSIPQLPTKPTIERLIHSDKMNTIGQYENDLKINV